ncbi:MULTISPECIES: NAD(P)/FAD-dependent oxidoreductase [unclassified Blastococcus]
MPGIVVCGGGVVGLVAAMTLARDGCDVTVLEADPDGAPVTAAAAWDSWRRHGVAHFHQPHTLHARFREVCDAELPGLTDRLRGAGCASVDPLTPMPPGITDGAPRPGDERFRVVTGRRPVVESAVAAAAEAQPGVTVRRGVRVAELLTGTPALPGIPHVTGVRTTTGEVLPADLVVDAGGRRTRSGEWLAGIGARQPLVESEDLGFVYYTRYLTGPTPPVRRGPLLVPLGSLSVLTLYADNDTWSVTLFTRTGDALLKGLRDPAAFDRVVAACPLQAHWLDGRPLNGVRAMAGTLDRHRGFLVDRRPVVTGFVAVGDAWACTNPSAGRGLSMGAVQVQLLRAVVAAHLDDPAALTTAFAEATASAVEPFYRSQVAADRVRVAEMRALAEGRPAPPATSPLARLQAGSATDPELFRALLEIILCLAPPGEVLARPLVRDRLEALGDVVPRPFPGPDRARLAELLAG